MSDQNKKIAVFPGQGSQYVKMGLEFYKNFQAAKDVFERVDNALNFKLSEIIFGDDEVELKKTENTQPALMAVSIAIAKVLEVEFNILPEDFKFVAGHSLGEYSALCFAKAISIEDTAIVLRERGLAMLKASDGIETSMVAVIGLDVDKIDEMIQNLVSEEQGGEKILVKANDNANGQIVLSGSKKLIDKVIVEAKKYGAKMAVALPVSGAFHSPYMRYATNKMKDVLSNVKISTPVVPVIQNVSVKPTTAPQEIKDNLILQIEGSVRWRETMLFCESQGVSELIEIGAKNVLCGLCKRTTPSISQLSFDTIKDLEKLAR
jgi:[acyl-carrier-protein] S-malonyltransferase